MSRLVPYANKGTTASPGAGPGAAAATDVSADKAPGTPAQDRIEAIAKYIPSEILAFYVPVVPAIELLKNASVHAVLQKIAFWLAWILVPIYFLWIGNKDARKWRQVSLSTFAFPIWAYATNRELGIFGAYYEAPGALILLLLFTLLTAFLLPKRQSGG
jgi:hypothetical protein